MEDKFEKKSPLFSILFVCLGNICRSPAAEGIMKYQLELNGLADKVFVDSAGIGSWHVGDLPDARMRLHGSRRGYDFCSRARQIRRTDFDRFNLIIVMDSDNYEDVCSLARNEDDRAKVHMMTEYLNHYKGRHSVPDPYYGGDAGFELVLDLLEDGCANLVRLLQKSHIV